MRVAYEEMAREFARVLEKKGFAAQDAADAADIFAQNSLAGVYSHGLNRFPRIVRYLDKGEIDPRARATCELRAGVLERWDGHRGFGPLNARRAMERACVLAKENGVGLVALGNNNHWLRGGTYGWLQTEASSASAGPTQCPICPHGEGKTAGSETTRSFWRCLAPTASMLCWTARYPSFLTERSRTVGCGACSCPCRAVTIQKGS